MYQPQRFIQATIFGLGLLSAAQANAFFGFMDPGNWFEGRDRYDDRYYDYYDYAPRGYGYGAPAYGYGYQPNNYYPNYGYGAPAYGRGGYPVPANGWYNYAPRYNDYRGYGYPRRW